MGLPDINRERVDTREFDKRPGSVWVGEVKVLRNVGELAVYSGKRLELCFNGDRRLVSRSHHLANLLRLILETDVRVGVHYKPKVKVDSFLHPVHVRRFIKDEASGHRKLPAHFLTERRIRPQALASARFSARNADTTEA
jgi:hypothetical protein